MWWPEIVLAALVATIAASAVNVGVYHYLTNRRASQEVRYAKGLRDAFTAGTRLPRQGNRGSSKVRLGSHSHFDPLERAAGEAWNEICSRAELDEGDERGCTANPHVVCGIGADVPECEGPAELTVRVVLRFHDRFEQPELRAGVQPAMKGHSDSGGNRGSNECGEAGTADPREVHKSSPISAGEPQSVGEPPAAGDASSDPAAGEGVSQ